MEVMAQANTAQAGKYICLCLGAHGQFYCVECKQFFCKTCRISHKKANVSKSHQLVMALETGSKDCEMCLTENDGQYYCLYCNQFFCSNCKTIHLRANVSKSHVFRYSSDLVEQDDKKTEKINDRLYRKIDCSEIFQRELTKWKASEQNDDETRTKSIGVNYPVRITIDSVHCEIKLDGILNEVINAKQEVFDALKKFAHTRRCKANAAIYKEQVQWYFKDLNDVGLPVLYEYPELLNMSLEMAHLGKSGLTEVEFADDDGEKYIIVLMDMIEYEKKDRTNKVDVLRREKVLVENCFEPPPEWDHQKSNVMVVTLLDTSPEYKIVKQKFLDSVFKDIHEWANQLNKQKIKVTQIERVQNLSLYHMYTFTKYLMDKHNPQGTNNENVLWHCTTESAAVSINCFGFNRSYCQDNNCYKDASWGEGVNFTVDASYSARRWLSRATASREQCMYMCQVLTGVSCPGKRGMRFLPVRRDGRKLKYDSATDNIDRHAEYVIFNDSQAYPQYCIKFKYL